MFMFFFNDTATTEIYTLSLHDALPILVADQEVPHAVHAGADDLVVAAHRLLVDDAAGEVVRSEEHTSELQSRQYLVCRLLLEKKKHPLQSSGLRSLGIVCKHACQSVPL